MKNKKEKQSYSLFSQLAYSVKWCFRDSAFYIFTVPLLSLLAVILSVYATYQSRFIIDALASGDTTKKVLLILAGVIGIRLLLTLLQAFMSMLCDISDERRSGRANVRADRFIASFDYETLIEPDTKDLVSFYANQAPWRVPNYYRDAVKVLEGVVTALAFGTLLSSLHPLIIVGLVILAVAQYFARKPLAKLNRKISELLVANDRRFGYAVAVQNNYENAKEMRLYNMSGWIDGEANKCLNEHRRLHTIEQRNAFFVSMLGHLLSFLRDGFSYVYLILIYAKGGITPGEFVMYSAAIATLASTLNGFAANFNKLNADGEYLHKIRRTEAIRSAQNHGAGLPLPEGNIDFELRHVSYRYKGAKEDTLKDINLKIKAGEKLAIVGMNGSGKTTLIRLLCGLFRPTEGEILVCGQPIDAYNIDEYRSLFSAVFQDIRFLPFSVAALVSACGDGDDIDRDRVVYSLEQASIMEKIESLPLGIDTPYNKSVSEDAVDFSGGEMQKLALARAIYLGRRVLVLDEPTAALDPVAENEMYLRFHEIAQSRTSLFISHRLASTRFCDRIVEIDGGHIAEEGTHELLMAAKGKYYEMFCLQAQYYTDKKKEDGQNETEEA